MTSDPNVLGDLLVLEFSILINSANDVENDTAANIYVQIGVNALNLTVSNHFDDSERVLVVPCEHADAICQEKGAEEGCRVNDKNLWDPKYHGTRDDAEAQGYRPENPVATGDLSY